MVAAGNIPELPADAGQPQAAHTLLPLHALIALAGQLAERDPGAVSCLLSYAQRLLDTANSESDLLLEWNELGRELYARRGTRLEIGMRAARFAALGGEGIVSRREDDPEPISVEEEVRIVAWFGDCVDEASRRGGRSALEAIWYLMVADRFEGTNRCRSAAVDSTEFTCPTESCSLDDPDYPAKFRAAAEDYARVLIAGATASEVERLRHLVSYRGADLDEYAPFQNPKSSDVSPDEQLECAVVEMLRARNNHEISKAVGDFVHATAEKRDDQVFPPSYKFGLVAWLAYRGLKKPRARRAEEAQVQP